MSNEYIEDSQPEFKRKYTPPQPGTDQYQRRKCQSWLKILGRNPKANNQNFLRWAAQKAKEEAPDYWKTHLEKAFRLKWQQNENAKAKRREALAKEQQDNG